MLKSAAIAAIAWGGMELILQFPARYRNNRITSLYLPAGSFPAPSHLCVIFSTFRTIFLNKFLIKFPIAKLL